MATLCNIEKRRDLVRAHATLNGIDYTETADLSPATADLDRVLLVEFLKPVSATAFGAAYFRIEGGTRGSVIRVLGIQPDPASSTRLRLTLSEHGGFSSYTLKFRVPGSEDMPPAGFDPLLANSEFRFGKSAQTDSSFASSASRPTTAAPAPAPDIDYLAKDYGSFRRLMMDRISALVPGWRARTPADLGVTLVELLAYVADRLSYAQDAVATEAHLGTARRRISVRRHARLVDYIMHDGCNARVWVQIKVSAGATLDRGLRLLTRTTAETSVRPGDFEALFAAEHPEIFETLHPVRLDPAHNELNFYTWGDANCCLSKGSTSATLKDDPAQRLTLLPGGILIFEERLGPRTGEAADADPTRRHAVRLTRVSPSAAASFDSNGIETSRLPGTLAKDELTGQPIVRVEWAEADALPFSFCLSSEKDSEHGGGLIENVSVALGNIVLADHGLSLNGEILPPVPAPRLFRQDEDGRRQAIPVRYRPVLSRTPLTFAMPYDSANSQSATAAFDLEPRSALPVIELTASGLGEKWTARRDLIGSDSADRNFVVEVEHDGSAQLRFGNGQNGKLPLSGTFFTAAYRIGCGSQGNVGASAIMHAVTEETVIVAVRNPLPARGGAAQESVDEVRVKAPHAFRRQERAVTAEDWENAVHRIPQVQRGAAKLRWTGSWHTAFVAADRIGGAESDPAYIASLGNRIAPLRLAGTALRMQTPEQVPIEIGVIVFSASGFVPSEVEASLSLAFSSQMLPGGKPGFFHPDNFTFGQPVYLSDIIVTADAVPGVQWAIFSVFRRFQGISPEELTIDSSEELPEFLSMASNEIVRCDNNPDFPEHGVFKARVFDREDLLQNE